MEKMEAKLEGQKRNIKEVKLFFSEKKRQIKIVEAMLEKHERLEALPIFRFMGMLLMGEICLHCRMVLETSMTSSL